MRTPLILLCCTLTSSLQAATVLEDWQLNDSNGTQMSALANEAGSASFANNAANALANGAGDLVFSVGADAGDNIFRTSNLTNTNVSSGIFQLEFNFTSVNFQGGDQTGANVGFGIRDTGSNTDIFIARIQKQNDNYLLQTRVGTTNTNIANLGSVPSNTLSNLNVRILFDLDTDLADVYWSLGGNPETAFNDVAINDLEMDAFRLAANTNTNDWGAGAGVSVDFVTLTAIPEPSSSALLGLGLTTLTLRRKRH
ncbi:PEP-CTERM sorting domain-containing protein [Rubritalea tangerina]|uniref:PEP-CTERM sorting domain-containing protein n=1 Tax=Rubritalea tangerina TaxID=430798 RepID=A0ABW4ZDD2_9BACT